MVLTILFLFLIFLGISLMLFFLFVIYLPSLKAQKIDAKDTLISHNDAEYRATRAQYETFDTNMRAVVLCSPNRDLQKKKFTYSGKSDCSVFVSVYDSEYDCNVGCLGFGNCERCCPRQSISIVNNTAVVGSSCNGCGLCVDVCPLHLITMVPKNLNECVLCRASENPSIARQECKNCKEYGRTTDLWELTKNHFNLWEKCYKLFRRK